MYIMYCTHGSGQLLPIATIKKKKKKKSLIYRKLLLGIGSVLVREQSTTIGC